MEVTSGRGESTHGFEAMFRAHYPDLLRFAARLAGEQAPARTELDEQVTTGVVARAALASLPVTEQEALRLTEWDGLSIGEAARVAVCSPATFRVRLHRARRPDRRPTGRRSADDRARPGGHDMNADVARALDELRRADPARDLEPAAPAVTSALLTEVCHRSTETETETEIEALAIAPARPRYRVGLAGVAAAAVAVAVAVGVAITGPYPDDSSTTSPGPGTGAHDANTRAVVARNLGNVTPLPGSTRVASAPFDVLNEPASRPAVDHLVDRAAFWTAPGTIAAAIAFYQAHPPAGMALTGTESAGPGNAAGAEQGLTFEGRSTARTQSPQIQVRVVPYRSGVVVRVDSMAIAVAPKPASASVGAVTSVDVAVLRPHAAPTVRRTLSGLPAQRLADAVDALPVRPLGQYGCGMDRGFTDQLIFRSSHRVREVVVRLGCVGVEIGDTTLNGTVDLQVTAALGIPADYGN